MGVGTRGTSHPVPVGFEAREDESANVKFFCDRAQNCKCKAVASIEINLFINRGTVVVSSIF